MSLTDLWQAERHDFLAARHLTPEELAQHRRSFMAGALAALTLQRGGVTREQLLAEIVMYGRTIGSTVETAS